MNPKVSCWAIVGADGRRPGWEVATASPAVPGEVETAHFFGPRSRERAHAYAATLQPAAQPRAAVPPLPPPPPVTQAPRLALPPAAPAQTRAAAPPAPPPPEVP